MKTDFKVAGTTFYQIPEIGLKINKEYEDTGNNRVPCADLDAVLMPEPENKYDEDAVKVIVPLKNGDAFHLGYVPRAEPLKTKITKPVMAKMTIRDYGMVGNYNASFIITEVEGI